MQAIPESFQSSNKTRKGNKTDKHTIYRKHRVFLSQVAEVSKTMEIMSLLYIFLLQFFTSCISCNAQNMPKFPAVFFFGDSTVDTGNNDYINTITKANHAPYGIRFPGQIPTGRFSDGKLVPDIFVSALGLKETLPPFLQPNLSDHELLTGVCFASAGSGYDDETTANSNAIPMLKQPGYFLDYLERLKQIAGEKQAKRIVNGALVSVNAGTVDFFSNFYLARTRRSLQFNISEYQDFLLKNMQTFLRELYDLGLRKMAVSGLPPIGCIPLIMTASFLPLRTCLEDINRDAQLYNQKLIKLLPQIEANLTGSKIRYEDIYNPVVDMIKNHTKYGFQETTKGCCGTGLMEAGPFCNPFTPLCSNVSQYIFFDSIHPGETASRYISDYLLKEVIPQFQ